MKLGRIFLITTNRTKRTAKKGKSTFLSSEIFEKEKGGKTVSRFNLPGKKKMVKTRI